MNIQAPTQKYLVPGIDWKTNLEAFSNGASKTQAEIKAQKSIHSIAQGQCLTLLQLIGAVTSIALGIILGITVHPGAYSLLAGVPILTGTFIYHMYSQGNNQEILKKKQKETKAVYDSMINGLQSIRNRVVEEVLKQVEKTVYQSPAKAVYAGNTAMKKLFQEKSNAAVQSYKEVEGLAYKVKLMKVSKDGDKKRDQVIKLANRLIRGWHYNPNSPKEFQGSYLHIKKLGHSSYRFEKD